MVSYGGRSSGSVYYGILYVNTENDSGIKEPLWLLPYSCKLFVRLTGKRFGGLLADESLEELLSWLPLSY